MSTNTSNNNIIKLDFQSNSYINSESSDNNEKKMMMIIKIKI